MTWRTSKVEDLRRSFIQLYVEKKFNISDLCKQFGISRTCGYKWIKRFKKEGWEGLKNRSPIPLTSPLATSPILVEEILNVKYEWP